jgi:hypothetical protein
MTPRRTEFAAFVLDLMDFIDGKVREALENEASRAGAIAEAGGAVPVLRDRLREREDVRGLFSLVLDNPMNDAAKWWRGLAGKDRAEFEAEVETLLRAWTSLRAAVVAEGDQPGGIPA